MKTFKFCVLVLIATAFTFPAHEVKLEYTFKVGDEYVWNQLTNLSIKQSFAGTEQNIESKISGVITLRVVSLSPTGAKMETKYTKMSMVMKMPSGMPDISFDSDGDQSKTENQAMKAIMDKPFTLTLSKKGTVEKVENTENLWSGFASMGLSEQQMNSLKLQLDQSFGEKSIKSSFENAFINYPDNKVKTGDTWKNKINMPGSFPLTLDNVWSVGSIAAESVNLTSDGSIATVDTQKSIDLPNGLKSKVDLNGAQKLSSIVNLKTGWPSEVKVLSTIKGNMTLLAGGMIPQDMDIPMEIVTESTYTIVRK